MTLQRTTCAHLLKFWVFFVLVLDICVTWSVSKLLEEIFQI